MNNLEDIDVLGLSLAATDVQPVNYDWEGDKFGDEWDVIYPSADGMSLEECYAFLTSNGCDLPDPNPWGMDREELLEFVSDFQHDDEEQAGKAVVLDDELRRMAIAMIDDEDVDGIEDWREAVETYYQENGSDGFSPMMSYYYPLPGYSGDEQEDQRMLDEAGIAVVLARVNDEVVLALSGGGMDLTMYIVEGYVRLGYLPPLHSCNFPKFAGTKLSTRMSVLFAAAIRTCEVTMRDVQYRKEQLVDYRNQLFSAGEERSDS